MYLFKKKVTKFQELKYKFMNKFSMSTIINIQMAFFALYKGILFILF